MSICRISVLWQRAPPLLSGRWCSSHLFWYWSTRDSGERAKEGKLIFKTFVHWCWMFINCCSSQELWLGYSHKPCLCGNENKSLREESNEWEGECVGGLWSFDYHMRGRTTTNKSLFTLGLRIIEPLCHRMPCNLWCHWETSGFERARIGLQWCHCLSKRGGLCNSTLMSLGDSSWSLHFTHVTHVRVLHWLEEGMILKILNMICHGVMKSYHAITHF